jgi:hypothetical protein
MQQDLFENVAFDQAQRSGMSSCFQNKVKLSFKEESFEYFSSQIWVFVGLM